MNISEQVATYLETATNTKTYYNELNTEECPVLLVQEVPTSFSVPPQVDASIHRIKVVARHTSNPACHSLIMGCYHAMQITHGSEDQEATGIIVLSSSCTCAVELRGSPVWLAADQKGRKQYTFEMILITQNL